MSLGWNPSGVCSSAVTLSFAVAPCSEIFFCPPLKDPCTMSQPSCAHVVPSVCGDLNQETTHQNTLLGMDEQPTETSSFQVIPLSIAFSPNLLHTFLSTILWVLFATPTICIRCCEERTLHCAQLCSCMNQDSHNLCFHNLNLSGVMNNIVYLPNKCEIQLLVVFTGVTY